jgi:long-chain acyl-CoA synthetase
MSIDAGMPAATDKPWLGQYDAEVPPTLAPYPDSTLLDVVHDTAVKRPAHPALIFKGASVTYGELDRWTDALARALRARGVARGDRVALLMPNAPQAVVAQFGAWKAGAIVAPLNPLYTEYELERALKDCGAETIVVLTPFYGKVKRVQARTAIRTIVATNIKEHLRPLERLLFSTFKEAKGGHRIELGSGDVWLSALIEEGLRLVDRVETPGPKDPALLLFTGGTTGLPKAALGSHHALLMSAMQTHAWFRPTLDEWNDVVILAMPLSHVYGNIGILATSLIGHHPVVLLPNPRDLGDVVRTIERTRAAFFPAVPALFNALLDHPRVNSGKADFSSVKLCISGSAPLMAESRRRFESLTGGRIVDAYSITEAMNAAIINPVDRPPRPGAIGVPLPDVELRIADLDGDRDVRAGEDGELLIRAPQLMSGYWGKPAESAEMIIDGWLHTGDIGHLDDDGYVHVVDRRKDMIKPGGYAVWPREVEEVIAAHPDVVEVGVAGVPDPHQGEAVKAWVVTRAGATLSTEDVRSWSRERLAPYKVPRQIEFRDELPRSHVGKVLRRDLVEDADEPRISMMRVNGVNLSVEDRGRGEESIVFAHGLLLSRRMFDHQLAALEDRYRCVAFDFRGHGRSEVTDDGYAVDELTEDAAALIRQLGAEPCHFVGHSLGAFVGLRLGVRHPELVRSLVLLSASADPQPGPDVIRYRLLQMVARRVGIRPLVPTLMGVLFSRAFLRDPDRSIERETWRQSIGAQSLAGALHAVDGVLDRSGMRDEISAITAPTLIVVGEQDRAAPLRLGKRINAGILGSQLITVPAGHTSPVEQPDAVTAAIERFLATNGTRVAH